MRSVECLVIGGGPGGLAAARTAARAGARVVLVDENRNLGGQYYRQLPEEFRVEQPASLGTEYVEGRKLVGEIRTLDIELKLDTVAWGIFDGRTVAVTSGERTEWIQAEHLILAPGAYDRPVPFPGWTLPGVVTAGGAQNLMKAYRVLPGRRVLIVGSGPLLLVVAHHLLEAGAKVEAVCEAASMRGMWRYAPRMVRHLNFVQQGYRYWREIGRANVPMLTGSTIRRVLGTTEVTGAVVSRCDGAWRPVPGTERAFEVDTVVVGYGFVSSLELSRLAGCELRYVSDMDAWVPLRNSELESTVAGVFVVGDGAGVAGSVVALQEGELAGLTVSRRLGRLTERDYVSRRDRVQGRLRRLSGFRAVMDGLYRVGPGLYTLSDEQTTICRCEEVTVNEAVEAIRDGATQPNEVKAWTRIGMGRCQGRMCEPAVVHILSRERKQAVWEVGRLTARTPVKPIPMAALISDEIDQPRHLGPNDCTRLAH